MRPGLGFDTRSISRHVAQKLGQGLSCLDRVLGVKVRDPVVGMMIGAAFLVVFAAVGLVTRSSTVSSAGRMR